MNRYPWLGWCVAASACGADGGGGDLETETAPASTSATEPATTAVSNSASDPTDATTPEPTSTGGSSDGESSSDSGDDVTPGDSSTTGVPTVPEGCFDYYGFEPTEVSFRNDVMPIFVESCWMCHANPNDDGIFLGYGGTTESEAVMVRTNLLTTTPLQAPAMELIVPGDPLTSWFMAKIDYDDPSSECPLINCPNPGCDWFAPPTQRLPEAQLALIRSWIINGAPDN